MTLNKPLPPHPAPPRKPPEILAPAGGTEAFFAALHGGADAVYLGLDSFNARTRAKNFSVDDLSCLMPLARAKGMKVLVTLNVVIKEVEALELCRLLTRLEPLGVHALIVQDLGLLRFVRREFPSFRLHASTQLAVHNLEGVLEARRLGFRRVVLARELTAVDIKRIREGTPPDVELEAFCHGSLCYSYSGLCFFSGAQDARSGNRGECAYTCREPYRIVSEPGHGFLFSMKDLDTSDAVPQWVEAGVDALKIEGRKKDAQYVATALALYRTQLDRIFGRATGRKPVMEAPTELAAQHDFTFHRAPTAFHFKGRYHENVIDLDEPSHKGAPAGPIDSMEGRWIRFTSSVALALHDGLRIDTAGVLYKAEPQHGALSAGFPKPADESGFTELEARYENEGLRFGIQDMRRGGRQVYEASPGDAVSILVPEGHPLPRVGELVRKTRSDLLRQKVDAVARPMGNERLRPRRQVHTLLRLSVSVEILEIEAEISLGDGTLARQKATCRAERPRGPARLEEDLRELFGLYGDSGFESLGVEIKGDTAYFVPRSILKALKQEISAKLPEAFERNRFEKTERAFLSWNAAPEAAPVRASTLAVKIDRMELLPALQQYQEHATALPITEWIFEPKRMFLGAGKPEPLWENLLAYAQACGVKLRLALPTVLRTWDIPHLKPWVRLALELAEPAFELGNLGARAVLAGLCPGGSIPSGSSLASDFFLYALNVQASDFLADEGFEVATLSIEDDRGNLGAHLAHFPWERIRPRAILYKDTPLFIAEACSLTALHHGCPGSKVCGYRSLMVENAKGERFTAAHEQCKTIVYGDEAYSISQHRAELEALGVRDFRVDFLTRPYAAEEALAVLSQIESGKQLAKTHRANYGRRLL